MVELVDLGTKDNIQQDLKELEVGESLESSLSLRVKSFLADLVALLHARFGSDQKKSITGCTENPSRISYGTSCRLPKEGKLLDPATDSTAHHGVCLTSSPRHQDIVWISADNGSFHRGHYFPYSA